MGPAGQVFEGANIFTKFRMIALFVGVALAIPLARAGGEMGDEAEHHDDGLAIFGFVRDAAGKPIVDAKVVAEVKTGTRMVARTSIVGLYRFSNFDKQVKAEDITISCSKDGYKQARIVKKPAPANPSNKAVEIECRLQAG
jgi:hypothetical protein